MDSNGEPFGQALFTIATDGRKLFQVTPFTFDVGITTAVGSYSPDGRWIVFRLDDHGRFGLYKVHLDGSHLRPILGLSDFAPRFIDWGTSTHPGDDDDNGDRHDDIDQR